MGGEKLALDVPTVFISYSFPVEAGLVQSFAPPGGNMTGITREAALEAYGKRLQILKDIVPDLKPVAVLGEPYDPNVRFCQSRVGAGLTRARDLARPRRTHGGRSRSCVRRDEKSETEAVTVIRSNLAFALGKQIADLALTARLPLCHFAKQAVVSGALVSFGASLVGMTGPAAAQTDGSSKAPTRATFRPSSPVDSSCTST
jgi:putative tryptophan/tyrosine transport system substrate-binding protein